MHRTIDPRLLAVGLGLVALAACGKDTPGPTATLTRAQLLDPETCGGCHQTHFAEWAGSMHAYAADDPVFLAMNARGQRETNGALGTFCVNCHAPMAVREGLTTDGLNLASLPSAVKGVTCYFCHTVASVTGAHNDPLTLAGGVTMLGEYTDPVANRAHDSAYSSLHDRTRLESASLCGSCHDIVSPAGAPIERTFAEWQGSVFSHAQGGNTCGQCHLPQHSAPTPLAVTPGLPARHTYSHTTPAVDLTLQTPVDAAQKAQVQALLDTTLQSALCVKQTGAGAALRVILDNVAAGHGFPSGATQDRRAWVEVIAYKAGNVIYQSGVVADGNAPTRNPDADLWMLRDCMFDASGKEVQNFWEAADLESNTLPTLTTFDATDPRYYQTHVVQNFPRQATAVFSDVPDRVTMRVRLQPVGLDVLDDLISTGDLDAGVRALVPTLDVGATVEWTPSTTNGEYIENGLRVTCVSNTNLNVAATKVPAVNHTRCAP
jgi:hypothetical protein